MSLPRLLSFVRDDAGLALEQEPVIAPLRTKGLPISTSSGTEDPVAIPYELDLQFEHPEARIFGVRLYSDEEHWTEIGFDMTRKQFYVDRTKSGAPIDKDFPAKTTAPLALGRPYNLKLIVDRSSVEAFAQNGTIAMTNLIYPLSSNGTIKIFPSDAKTATFSGQVWRLKSIWDQPPLSK
jgi:fructan beta-fructosidase